MSPLVGTWTGHTFTPASGNMQVTLQFTPDGRETVSSIMPGMYQPITSVSQGTYTITDNTLVQTLDAHYPGSEILTLDGPYDPHPPEPRISVITSQWIIAGKTLTLKQQAGNSCILQKQ